MEFEKMSENDIINLAQKRGKCCDGVSFGEI